MQVRVNLTGNLLITIGNYHASDTKEIKGKSAQLCKKYEIFPLGEAQ